MRINTFIDSIDIQAIKDIKEFKAIYRDQILPNVDWQTAIKNDYIVTRDIYLIDDKEEIGNFYTVWGNPDKDGRLNINRQRIKNLHEKHLKGLWKDNSEGCIRIVRVSAIETEDNTILLDGNHRVSHLYHKYKGSWILIVDSIIVRETDIPILLDQLLLEPDE